MEQKKKKFVIYIFIPVTRRVKGYTFHQGIFIPVTRRVKGYTLLVNTFHTRYS